jgi:hypothetical protein
MRGPLASEDQGKFSLFLRHHEIWLWNLRKTETLIVGVDPIT